MNRFVVPLVALVGACLVLTGAWWMWTGYDIVQIERGWSSVIAGATMLAAGFVILVLAAVLRKLDELTAALQGNRSPHAEQPVKGASGPAVPPPPVLAAEAVPHADLPERDDTASPSPREIVGTHVSGDATYTMYSDGSVEAKTGEGTLNFASLDELRAYADERALADAR